MELQIKYNTQGYINIYIVCNHLKNSYFKEFNNTKINNN